MTPTKWILSCDGTFPREYPYEINMNWMWGTLDSLWWEYVAASYLSERSKFGRKVLFVPHNTGNCDCEHIIYISENGADNITELPLDK